MIILGIETSCDETALALVENGTKVIKSLVASQIAMHAPFGGVIPEIAAREHLTQLPLLWEELRSSCPEEIKHIDAISVSQGPGLVGALLVGGSFAKGLALTLDKPLIPINHVHGHVYGALLGLNDFRNLVQLKTLFPALALVVSGGHTHLYLMQSLTDFRLKCFSRDDACGEAFDKVAKLMGLGYPGGPRIEQEALSGDASIFAMPKVAERKEDLFFSYSGLKTFTANIWKKVQGLDKASETKNRQDLCAAFQDAAFEQIIRKIDLVKDDPDCTEATNLIIAGGVAANKRLRALASEKLNLTCHFPGLAYCSDNAAMIASAGYFYYKFSGLATSYQKSTTGNWDVYAQYPYS